MRHLILIAQTLVLVLALAGPAAACDPADDPPISVDLAGKDGPPPGTLPLIESYEDITTHDGERVVVIGTYETLIMSKAPTQKPATVDDPIVKIVTKDGSIVLLGVYYQPSGLRPEKERKEFYKKTVAVVGTIHAQTPTQYHDGIPMQTCISPYVGLIESVQLYEPKPKPEQNKD